MNREKALKILVELLNRLSLNTAEQYAVNDSLLFLSEATKDKKNVDESMGTPR